MYYLFMFKCSFHQIVENHGSTSKGRIKQNSKSSQFLEDLIVLSTSQFSFQSSFWFSYPCLAETFYVRQQLNKYVSLPSLLLKLMELLDFHSDQTYSTHYLKNSRGCEETRTYEPGVGQEHKGLGTQATS